MKRTLMYTLIIWLLIFAILETGVRAYDYFNQNASDKPESTTDAKLIFIPHPFTTYAANPSNINHNAQGYRAEKNRTYKPDPNSINIVALGGSSTYGTRVHTRDSYPYQLEEILQKSVDIDKKINVINSGLGGYSTPNIIALLSGKVIHLKPKIIIIYTGFNDAWTRLMFSGFQTDYSHAQKTWDEPEFPFWRYSRLLEVVAVTSGLSSSEPHIHEVAWKPKSGAPEENFRNSSAEVFKANLMTLISISRTHGAIPILVTQATDFKNHPLPGHNKTWNEAMREHTNSILQVANEMSVDVVDVRTQMTNEKTFFLDALHMNREGNRKRAEIIADYLVKNSLMGKNVKAKESATLALVSEYIKLIRADVFVKRVLTHVIGEMRKSGKEINTSDEETIINAFSSFKNVTAVYSTIYKDLSNETLVKANEFFNSELGKKFISSYSKNKNSQKIQITEDENRKIQAYQASPSWQEIEKQRQYINRDALIISGNVIEKFMNGKLILPDPVQVN